MESTVGLFLVRGGLSASWAGGALGCFSVWAGAFLVYIGARFYVIIRGNVISLLCVLAYRF